MSDEKAETDLDDLPNADVVADPEKRGAAYEAIAEEFETFDRVSARKDTDDAGTPASVVVRVANPRRGLPHGFDHRQYGLIVGYVATYPNGDLCLYLRFEKKESALDEEGR